MSFSKFLVVFICSLALATTCPERSLAEEPCTLDTFAGGGDPTPGDGQPAVSTPIAPALDGVAAPDGTIYISSNAPPALRRISPSGVIETLVDETVDLDLVSVLHIAASPDGSAYYRDGATIRRYSPNGGITLIAGNGGVGAPFDGALAAESPLIAGGLDKGTDGTIFYAETSRHRIRAISVHGAVFTVAGDPPIDRNGIVSGGFAGDGGSARAAQLDHPADVAVGPDGSVYIADRSNRRIRRVGPDGVITTVMGGGNVRGDLDGVAALEARLSRPSRVAVDGLGRVLFVEGMNLYRLEPDGVIRRVTETRVGGGFFGGPDGSAYFWSRSMELIRITPDGESTSVAGNGEPFPHLQEGLARETTLRSVFGLAVGPDDELFAATGPFVVTISSAGDLRRVAGGGDKRWNEIQDGESALDANLSATHLTVDDGGRVFVSSSSGNRGGVLAIEPDGSMRRVAGQLTFCADPPCGLGGAAVDSVLSAPGDLAVAASGDLYFIAEVDVVGLGAGDQRIFQVDSDGILSLVPAVEAMETLAGRYSLTFAHGPGPRVVYSIRPTAQLGGVPPFYELREDGSSAPLAAAQGFAAPNGAGLATDAAGSIYFTTGDAQVRKARPDGRVVTLAGIAGLLGAQGGDGQPARDALFRDLSGLALSESGNLYIADTNRERIFRIPQATACGDEPVPEVASGGLRHGANFAELQSGGTVGVSPGSIVSIFGRGLGPENAVGARVENGRLVTNLGGVRVLVDGVPSAQAFVSKNQINAIIPYVSSIGLLPDFDGVEAIYRESRLVVEYDGKASDSIPLLVREARPGIFLIEPGISNRAAVLNQDGTLNGPESPAAQESIVIFFGTGEGVTDPDGVDGLLAVEAFPRPRAAVQVHVGGVESELLYAGAAPGFTAGLFQANAKLGAGTPTGVQQLVWRVSQIETSVPIWVGDDLAESASPN